MAKKTHTHRRHVANGPAAAKRRRQGALERLEAVKEPNARQTAEIETLTKRVGRAS